MISRSSVSAAKNVKRNLEAIRKIEEISVVHPQHQSARVEKQSQDIDTRAERPSVPSTSDAGRKPSWDALLKQMSYSISSYRWEGVVVSSGQSSSNVDHVASRSSNVLNKLPRRKQSDNRETSSFESQSLVNDARRKSVPTKRLSQNLVVELYRLHRQDPDVWNCSTLAEIFHLHESDVAVLMRYNRTYLPQQVFGVAKGLYDPAKGVERFEDLSFKGGS